MPFKSQAQRKWMYANHPEMAKEWEKETPKDKKLPKKVKKKYQFAGQNDINMMPKDEQQKFLFDLLYNLNQDSPAEERGLSKERAVATPMSSREDRSRGIISPTHKNIDVPKIPQVTKTGEYTLESSNPYFNAFYGLQDVGTLLAKVVNNIKDSKEEYKKYIESIQPRAGYNKDSEGLNPAPIYYQKGGATVKPIMAEAGEVYQSPDGGVSKVPDNAPTHNDPEGGAIVLDAFKILEDTGDKRGDIESKLLLVQPDELLQMTGVFSKKPVTHSKAYELGSEKIDKDVKKTSKFLQKNVDSIEKSPNDPYSKNSLNMNFNRLGVIPTKGDLFDILFSHQEDIKRKYNIDNGGEAQNGAINITPYSGDRTDSKNKSKYSKQEWEDFAKEMGFKGGDTKAFQEFLFSLNGDSGTPNVQADIINSHQKYGDPNPVKGTDPTGLNRWIDGRLGYRWDSIYEKYKGQSSPLDQNPNDYDIQFKDKAADYFPPEPAPKSQPFANSTTVDPNRFNKEDFNFPLKWYDVATPIAAFIDATHRRGVPYNTANLVEPKVKYMNPLPELNAGQADYNAALATLPGNGVGYANQANLFAKKYSIDSQILGKYENINNGLWNSNEAQVADIRNKQALIDQAARKEQEYKISMGLEAQRQQMLRSMDDITTTIAQNAKYNREGKLLMKLFPAFNPSGDYNGYKYRFTKPTATGVMSELERLKLLEKSKSTLKINKK